MANAQLKFSFEIQGFDKDAFHVVRFTGEEGISQLYHFEIELFARDKDVDFEKALSNTATFSIKRKLGDIPFHGILKTFEQLSHSGPYTFYRAVLVPKAWWLTQTTHNQVFLDQNNEHFLTAVLKDGGLSPGLDFKLSLQGSYPTWEYICQYDETHFEFASRWMERDGLYYFFQQGATGEKMLITDSLTSHGPMPQGESFRYSPPSNMQVGHEEEVITDFTLTQHRLPQKVQLKDYNYQTPSLELSAEAPVSQNGQGIHYLYGLHFMNTSQGEALAKIRAEDFKCREKLFNGVSSIPFVRPGYTFKIDNHYRGSFNQSYQTISCRHEGSQEAWLVSGLGLTFSKERDNLLFYRNNFTAIPASVQFRAELGTERPKISGTLNAKVDAASSGQYAEVDSQGRYKIIMPFDLSGRKDGHASAWVRMAQPYAGAGFGMHMPLHKGCEVLITFEGGDPDRPVIAASVPNPETTSPVTDQNQTQACITTAGGNQIHIQDQDGSQRILLNSTAKGNFIRIGAHNDPAVDWGDVGDTIKEMATDGINLTTPQWFNVKAEFANQIVLADNTQTTVGFYSCNYIGGSLTFFIGPAATFHVGPQKDYTLTRNRGHFHLEEAGAETTRTLGALAEQVMDHTQTLGEHTQTIAEHNRIIDIHTDTIAEHVQAIAEHEQTIGTHTEQIASHERTIGTHTEQIASHERTIGTHTEQIAAHERTIGTHTAQIGSLQETAGDVNKMRAEVTELATNVSVLAAAVEYM